MKNIGIILAGGIGARFDSNQPKQFMKVAGKMVIEHTIDAFQNSTVIDEIAVVVHENYVDKIEQLCLNNKWSKLKKILRGGTERYLSSLVAINAYEEYGSDINLIFHDAVRPLISQRILIDIANALKNYDAVDVAVHASDTIIMGSEYQPTITNVPNRNYVYQGQTPQAFKLNTLKKAYDVALQDENFRTSDDCGVVVKYLPDTSVYIVDGEQKNIKLTYTEDLYLLDRLFQMRTIEVVEKKDLSGIKGKVIAVFGGSEGIGEAICNLAKTNGAKVYPFSRRLTRTDIRNYDDIKKAFSSVYKIENAIDFVVLTAALLTFMPFHEATQAEIDQIIDIDYRGMAYVSHLAYPFLKESKGQLLHFTSSSYTLGRPFYGLYSSSKAAVVNFTQSLAQEWDSVGIRVNCINPERTKTAMRVRNFGVENEDSLLDVNKVASTAIATLLSEYSGQVIDCRR